MTRTIETARTDLIDSVYRKRISFQIKFKLNTFKFFQKSAIFLFTLVRNFKFENDLNLMRKVEFKNLLKFLCTTFLNVIQLGGKL